MGLGERLRILRNNRPLTGRAAATYLGISAAHYSNIEKGHALPSLDLLVKLANFYGVTTDQLLGRTDGPDPLRRDKAPPPYAVEMAAVLQRLGADQGRRLLVMAEALAADEEKQRLAAREETRVEQIADLLGEDAFKEVMDAVLFGARTGDDSRFVDALRRAGRNTPAHDAVEQG